MSFFLGPHLLLKESRYFPRYPISFSAPTPLFPSSLKNLLFNSLGRPSNRPSYLSEHLRNPSIGPPKSPKRPFLGLLGVFPPKPLKGPKTPFLGPF